MSSWSQNYDPAHNILLSSAVAMLPILFFFITLLVLRIKGYIASTLTVLLTSIIALAFYHMPVACIVASWGYGFLYGLWPIAWIILGAVFLYKLSVKSGYFEIIRKSIIAVTDDQRLQIILVAYAFGAFLEGAAGFGAPVAITTALLVGLGVSPIIAGGLCLLANAAPGAFGAMGIPVIVGGQVINTDPSLIAHQAMPSLAVISLAVPFILVFIADGLRGLREVWLPTLVAAVTFAGVQTIVALSVGPELPDIVAALATLLVLPVFLRVWKPANKKKQTEQKAAEQNVSAAEIMRAWAPFAVLTVCVAIWSSGPFKSLFKPDGALSWTSFTFRFPLLHDVIIKMPPVTSKPTPYHAFFQFDPISSVGTSIMLAAIISTFIVKIKPAQAISIFLETLKELLIPIYTIGTVLSFAFLANYSGVSATLALLFASTGSFFVFLSPVLGWLGVFLTGSDTSSNALFGGLQAATGAQIHVSGALLVAANTVGGAVGKMISPQSIAVACAAVNIVGKEGEILQFTLKWSLLLVGIVGLLVVGQTLLFN